MFQPVAPPDHYNAIMHDYDLRIERLQRRRRSVWRLAVAIITVIEEGPDASIPATAIPINPASPAAGLPASTAIPA